MVTIFLTATGKGSKGLEIWTSANITLPPQPQDVHKTGVRDELGGEGGQDPVPGIQVLVNIELLQEGPRLLWVISDGHLLQTLHMEHNESTL